MKSDLQYKLNIEDEAVQIKELLQNRLRFSSRFIRKLKNEGGVFLNEEAIRFWQKGQAGDILSVVYPKEESYFEAENIPLDVAYEDDDLIVLNKQPDLVVHPTKNYQTGTLAHALAFYLKEKEQSYKIRFVNRLDRDTSGLIIIAKNGRCQDFLSKEMQANRVVKKYLAVVHGVIDEDEGVIDLPIDKDEEHIARRIVAAGGYDSTTHYKVLERFYSQDKSQTIPGYSFVELQLETGRTHQIRVHLTHIGHPIVGDQLYGELYGYRELLDWMPRQALHAAYLEFKQPTTGKQVCVKAELPQDIESCLAWIKSLE